MNYLIHNSVEQMLVEAENAPDWEAARNKYPNESRYVNLDMKILWNNWTKGTAFNGDTSKVIEECRGEHEYEARIMSDKSHSMMSDDFMKKRFTFRNKQLVGQRVDIPRYLSGDQRCWFATKKIKKIAQAVRVYAPIGGMGNVSKEEMQVCGALTCSVVEKLESEGINVELWAAYFLPDFFHQRVNANDDDGMKVCGLIKIKDSSEYSDLGMISYVTGNNYFYRNIVFKSRVKFAYDVFMQTGIKSNCGGNYHSLNFLEEYILPDGEYTKENTIVIPRIYHMDIAIQWFNNKFDKEEEE